MPNDDMVYTPLRPPPIRQIPGRTHSSITFVCNSPLTVRKIDGTWLRQQRELKGWTQQQAAARLGVSQTYLSLLENGRRLSLYVSLGSSNGNSPSRRPSFPSPRLPFPKMPRASSKASQPWDIPAFRISNR